MTLKQDIKHFCDKIISIIACEFVEKVKNSLFAQRFFTEIIKYTFLGKIMKNASKMFYKLF